MKSAAKPLNESQRLVTLRSFNILDTPPERAFDGLTELAAQLCGTPIAAISFIDADRGWIKSQVGLEPNIEIPRAFSICAHAILQPVIMEVNDTRLDERFVDNPSVTGHPNICFYAGMPLQTSEGHALGTLCVIDQKPRQLTQEQRQGLTTLSRYVVDQLELRKKVAELHQINDSKHKVLTVLSHDLRTAFNVQINYSEQLARKLELWDKSRIKECAVAQARSARDAYRMLTELLDWSRLELGAFQFEPELMNVLQLIADVVSTATAQAEQKAIQIRMEVDSSLRLFCDKTMMQSILNNTVSNAIKFSESNSVITLCAQRTATGIRISVIDTGRGMTAQQAAELFSQRGFTSSRGTHGETGTGVGTKLVREFVDRHGGHVEASSTPGEGTTIHITLPDLDAAGTTTR